MPAIRPEVPEACMHDHLINMETCSCPAVHIYLAEKVIDHVTDICHQLYTHDGVWKHAVKHMLVNKMNASYHDVFSTAT